MHVPIRNLPVVYHLGTLDAADRGKQHTVSQEGAGLSVSVTPSAWEDIARLGGSRLNRMTRQDALFVDLNAMDDMLLSTIQGWARGAGLVEISPSWRLHEWDEETEEWRHWNFSSQEAALAQLSEEPAPGEAEDEFLERLAEERGIPGGDIIQQVPLWTLTEAGSLRARGFGRGEDATDMAVMFWAEDVLVKTMPGVVGVWWDHDLDPSCLSAPKGAILPSKVTSFVASEISWNDIDDDEELLAACPEPRLVDASDLRSSYAYVTSCVDSSAERIGPMVDGAAVEDLEFKDFAKRLGNGRFLEGRRMLDAAFPDYRAGGMSLEKDPNVGYRASSFDGMPCLYVVHSRIEYVFQRTGLSQAPVAARPGTSPPDDEVRVDEECSAGFGY